MYKISFIIIIIILPLKEATESMLTDLTFVFVLNAHHLLLTAGQ